MTNRRQRVDPRGIPQHERARLRRSSYASSENDFSSPFTMMRGARQNLRQGEAQTNGTLKWPDAESTDDAMIGGMQPALHPFRFFDARTGKRVRPSGRAHLPPIEEPPRDPNAPPPA